MKNVLTRTFINVLSYHSRGETEGDPDNLGHDYRHWGFESITIVSKPGLVLIWKQIELKNRKGPSHQVRLFLQLRANLAKALVTL